MIRVEFKDRNTGNLIASTARERPAHNLLSVAGPHCKRACNQALAAVTGRCYGERPPLNPSLTSHRITGEEELGRLPGCGVGIRGTRPADQALHEVVPVGRPLGNFAPGVGICGAAVDKEIVRRHFQVLEALAVLQIENCGIPRRCYDGTLKEDLPPGGGGASVRRILAAGGAVPHEPEAPSDVASGEVVRSTQRAAEVGIRPEGDVHRVDRRTALVDQLEPAEDRVPQRRI